MEKIVICEDEHIVSLDIKRSLIGFGYEVVASYSTGEAAVEGCAHLKADLILMDIRLAGKMDGIEAARHIYDTYDIPVILLSAYADEETVNRAKGSRPFGYIIKPFEERELRTTIEIALYRHSMDRKLRESEARYRTLFHEAPSANFASTVDGIITDANEAFMRLFAFSVQDPVRDIPIVDRFADPSEGRRLLSRALTEGQTISEEYRMLRRDGAQLSVLATIAAAPRSDGKEPEIWGYLVDLTERRELELQLRQAQKMEAIGRLAGGVAHDFNNIITAIMGYGNLLSEDVGDSEVLKDEVSGILNSAKKAANLTRQLLSFSRKQPLESRIVDINVQIAEMERMLRRLVDENVCIKLFTDAEHPLVSIDPGQFEQVLINLVVNARDAMPSGGVLIIDTLNVVGTGKVHQHGVSKGEWVLVQVKDSGIGIKAEDIQRIFDPFFTTKGPDLGTGLGLSTVYGIVNQSGGRIAVESEVGKGTTFFVYFPLSSGASTASPQLESAPTPVLVSKTGTVLLVEDDDYLRALLSRVLSKSGFRVLEAANPGEAILIAEHETSFLLVADIVMPHMSGYELANRLAEKRSDLRALFMSGYPEKRLDRDDSALVAETFIQKPFTHEQLLEALASLESEP